MDKDNKFNKKMFKKFDSNRFKKGFLNLKNIF